MYLFYVLGRDGRDAMLIGTFCLVSACYCKYCVKTSISTFLIKVIRGGELKVHMTRNFTNIYIF